MYCQKYTALFICFFLLSFSVSSQALTDSEARSYQLGVAYGNTYVSQNVGPLKYSEASLQQSMATNLDWLPSFIVPKLELNLGELSTGGSRGYLLGVGPKLDLRLSNNVTLGGAFRFVYLDKFKLRSADSRRTRNYGGHRQFQYYWELMYRSNDTVAMGYRWLHMSNGMQVLPKDLKYEHNPVIETHNLVLTLSF